MLNNLPEQLKDPRKLKGGISILAAVVMFFTPDYVDEVIKAFLVAVGGIDIMRTDKRAKKK